MPPLPEPHTTPTSYRSISGILVKSSPASLIAWSVAAIAYWVKRSYFFNSFLSMYCAASKSFTSQPKCVLNFVVSNFVRVPAPLFPATIFSQNSFTEFPNGVIAPRPVTTTLNMFTLYFNGMIILPVTFIPFLHCKHKHWQSK